MRKLFQITIMAGVIYMAGFSESMAEVIRKAAVAGRFYTEDASSLRDEVRQYLSVKSIGESPRLLISPHAGFVFSGPIAGKGYASISTEINRVILIGPSHYSLLRGVAVTEASAYETPLGKVSVDKNLVQLLRKSPIVCSATAAEEQEHSIEVQLPFLQVHLGEFTVVPILLSKTDPSKVAELIFPHIDERTVVVASSDFSHFYNQQEARRADDRSIATILAEDPHGFLDACGEVPIRVIMHLAKKMGLRPVKLDARTSFETAPQHGSASRVVGYASIAYVKPEEKSNAPVKAATVQKPEIPEREVRQFLLKLARKSMESAVRGEKIPPLATVPDKVKENSGCFVTLKINGSLRGCIGYIEPIAPLYKAIIENAQNAALKDPRFSAVRIDELDKVKVEVSVLTKPEPLPFSDPDDLIKKLIPGVHGVILQRGSCQSTFLPQVWEQLPDKIAFLEQLAVKGGMGRDGWKSAQVKVYRVEHFEE